MDKKTFENKVKLKNKLEILDLITITTMFYVQKISQMLPTGGKLSSIAFGLEDHSNFMKILDDISGEHITQEDQTSEGNYMRHENKRYFFNVDSNKRGTYMRISEVAPPSFQSSIKIPEKSWSHFIEIFKKTSDSYRSENQNTQVTRSYSDY